MYGSAVISWCPKNLVRIVCFNGIHECVQSNECSGWTSATELKCLFDIRAIVFIANHGFVSFHPFKLCLSTVYGVGKGSNYNNRSYALISVMWCLRYRKCGLLLALKKGNVK